MIHTLQLVVKLVSQDRHLKPILQKVQKIVSAIRHSTSAQQELFRQQKLTNVQLQLFSLLDEKPNIPFNFCSRPMAEQY